VHAALLEIPDIATVLASRGDYAFRLVAGRHQAERLAQVLAEAGNVGPPFRLIEGLHLSAGRPFAHELRSISLAEVPDAATVDFALTAPGSWLLDQVAWSDAQHGVAAVNPSQAVAAALEISRGTACLQVSRVTWRNGRAITAVVQTFPGDRYDLVGRFGPNAATG
jgi:GntR family transcriptional regulator, histidine utilization repressor